jgi:ABC-type bacteriocin/lantibiotic exporter with double-glycine peptidase domain
VNGHDIANVSSASLRMHVVLAEQTPRMFHGTVLENVRFGHNAEDLDAERALTFVGLRPLLDSLPQRASTVLNFQGSNLSGGQRQRVGIARALVRSADVLILDEGTSALDITSRNQILDKLLEEYRDKILIFVTHDPQVIGRATRVIELQSRQAGPVEQVSA